MEVVKPWWEQIIELLLGMLTKQTLTSAGATPEQMANAKVGTMGITGTGYSAPQRPPVIQHFSPNYRRTPGRAISCVVIHATATDGLASPLGWLCNPESKVSAHYLIGQDGTVYQLVHDEDVAWHAGVSSWRGRSGVNDFSIGIELVSPNDGTPYPEPQVAACAQLTRAICDEHGISPEDVIGHLDVAPGRKNDPMGFDFVGFRGRLAP